MKITILTAGTSVRVVGEDEKDGETRLLRYGLSIHPGEEINVDSIVRNVKVLFLKNDVMYKSKNADEIKKCLSTFKGTYKEYKEITV